MLKLGNLIQEDVFLIEKNIENWQNSWQENYRYHLINNEFKSFKIGIPFDSSNELVTVVNTFIKAMEISGSLFYYFCISPDVKLIDLITENRAMIKDSKVYLLLDKEIKYSRISPDFWDINLMGFEIIILKCDRLKECQNKPSTIGKYSLKGALIGITGSANYSFGIMHKRKIAELHNEKLVDFWITESISQNESNYIQEIKLKTELLMNVQKQ